MIKNNNPFVYVALSLVFALAFPQEAEAQWVEMNNGLYGGSISSMVISGSNIFAGTWSGGVFLSTNNGTSWTAVNTGLTIKDIRSIVISGSNIFAGTWGDGVFLSTNNGTSWTAVNTGLTNTNIQSFAISGGNLFAGTSSGGVFLSTNNGTSWTAVNTGLTNTNIQSLAIIGSNLFAGTYGGGVFLSTNNGTSWTAVNTGLTNTTVFSLAISGSNLFAGTYGGGGVFMSTNNGTSWTAVDIGLTNTNVSSLAISGTNIFAATTGSGVFLSINNGASWTAVNTGLTNTNVFSLAISDSNIFAGTDGGVFLSTNNGTSWTEVNTGLTNINVQSLAISGSNIFAGTSDNGVFLSTSNGNSWTTVNTGVTNTDIRSVAISGSNIFAGTYGGGVFLSTNNGTSWTAVNSGLTIPYVLSLAISGSNLFAGIFGGVFLSTNNGTSWTATGLAGLRVISLAISGSNIFAGTNGGVFLSTNNGTSWTVMNTGLTNTSIESLAISGSNLFAGTSSGVFLSTNNGTSWTATGLAGLRVISLAISGSNIFAGTNGGVFLSTNNGTSWTAVNTGLTNVYTQSLAISGSNLFAGASGQGLFSRLLSDFPPTITSFTPTSASVGATVTINGANFSATSNYIVKFNNTVATVTSSTSNSLTVIVPPGATTGKINVTREALTVQTPNEFLVLPLSITSFSPGIGAAGSSVTINGAGFSSVNANNTVSFNGVAATVTASTPTTITASVPAGNTAGKITVTVSGTAATSADDFGGTLSLTSFTPASAQVGSSITIAGTGFSSTPTNQIVKFNNTVATVTSSSLTSLTVSVPTGATTGKISVQRETATVLSPNEFLVLPLTITSFSPGIGASGASVIITGTGFSSVNANNIVSFNGVAATVTASTPTTITASIPAGNTVGKITITVNGTTASSAADFGGTLSLTSFTPTSAQVGSSISIAGTGFSSTPNNQIVKFNNTVATVTSGSLTSLTVTVPAGATTGKLSVQRDNTTVLSATEFLMLPLSITSIYPGAGAYGSSVTITGTGFSSLNANNVVSFDGVTATVTSSTPTSITATVPTNSTAGKITITVAGETATSTTNFIITTLAINSITYPDFFILGESSAPVSILVNDINEVQSVKIHRRGITEDDSKINSEIITYATIGNSINLLIPASFFSDPLGLYSWFSLTEKSGLDIPSNSGNIYLKYPSSSSEQIIPDLKSGKSASAYQLISVPLELTNNNILDVFTDLGKYDDRKWRLYSLNGTVIYEKPSLLEIGLGYWFIMRDQKEINPGEGTVVKVTRETPYKMKLIQGWNFIGNPYNFSISWNDVLTHNKLPEEKLKIRQYLNGTLGAEPILNRYRGAFIYSDVDREIEIPVINKSNGGRVAGISFPTIDEKEWHVNLTVEDGEFSNTLLGFGMNPKASENKDLWDETTLPMVDGLSSFHFSLREVQGDELIKDIVPTKENYTWQATISSDYGGSIQWDNSYFGNNDKKIVLELSDRVELFDMRTSTEIVIPKGRHILKFHFGNDGYIKSQVLESTIRIGNIYPNPIKRNEGLLSVSVSLPEGKNEIGLSLQSIYGNGPLLSGKGVYDGGRQAVSWATDFSQMPTGLYVLKIETINANGLRLTDYRKVVVE